MTEDILEDVLFIETNVAGVTFIKEMPWKSLTPGRYLTFKRDPLNVYDSNAIEVLLSISNKRIGYIRRDVSMILADLIDNGDTFYGVVKVITGGTDDKPNQGIIISIYRKQVKDPGLTWNDAKKDETFYG